MKQKKRITIERFDIQDEKQKICCNKFYNYIPTQVLKDSMGVETCLLPMNRNSVDLYEISMPDVVNKVIGLSLFKQHFPDDEQDTYRLLVYADNKRVYLHEMFNEYPGVVWLYKLEFENNPITLAYKYNDTDAIIISDGNVMKLWRTNYNPMTIENVPVITDMCINEGVLYCTLKEPAYKIWYATDLNPETVGFIGKHSKYIELNNELGKANRSVVMNGDVYIIRDYGISKITLLRGEFIVSDVYSTNTLIFSKTVAVCDNLLIFMTKYGLYSYNGINVKEIKLGFTFNITDSAKMNACSLGGKYYLTCRLDFKDDFKVLCENLEYVNNSLVILNTNDFSYQIIRGVDINNMLPLKTENFEKMLVTFNSGNVNKIAEVVENSSYFEEGLPKFWSSEDFFNEFDTKLFTKLVVNADKNIKFKLIFDSNEQVFTTYTTGINEFAFRIISKQLRLEISSTEKNAEVEDVYLDYYDYR